MSKDFDVPVTLTGRSGKMPAINSSPFCIRIHVSFKDCSLGNTSKIQCSIREISCFCNSKNVHH